MNTGEDPREGTLLCNLKFRDMSVFFAEDPEYRSISYRVPEPPKGSRGNPSGAKLEDGNTLYVPDTARWFVSTEK